MKNDKIWTSSEICEKIDEYVVEYACKDGCVRVENVESAKTRWRNVRQGVFQSEGPQEPTACTDLLCRSGEGTSTRSIVAVVLLPCHATFSLLAQRWLAVAHAKRGGLALQLVASAWLRKSILFLEGILSRSDKQCKSAVEKLEGMLLIL